MAGKATQSEAGCASDETAAKKGIITIMNQEQLNALYGPSAPFSEHHRGDSVQFRHDNEIKAGTILHVRAPGPTHEGGKELSLLYIVDAGEGFPVAVKPSQIVHGSFQAVLASYGLPDSALSSREQAEALSMNVQGQIIETEQGRLRVLSALVEGAESQGRVIAECEAVEGKEGH